MPTRLRRGNALSLGGCAARGGSGREVIFCLKCREKLPYQRGVSALAQPGHTSLTLLRSLYPHWAQKFCS